MDEVDKELFAQAKERGRQRRAANREKSTQILKDRGIPFVTKNGVHLIVARGLFDFWPSTGKYYNRVTGKYKRGVFNLIKEIENGRAEKSA